jgi:predicted transcriptional regulator
MKYRSKTDIIAQILEAANGGSFKTKIMYKSYLSHAQTKDYLKTLNESGLIDYDVKKQIYKTTEKGIRLLQIYNNIGSFISLPAFPFEIQASDGT